MGVIAQDESKAMQSAPAWSQYDNNEEYWKLMEALGKCAKETGIFLFVYFGYLFSPSNMLNSKKNLNAILETSSRSIF